MFKPIAATLDEAIALYESRAFERYVNDSRAVTHYTPTCSSCSSSRKMGREVPVVVGFATPTNYAETIVEVQNFQRWMITDPRRPATTSTCACRSARGPGVLPRLRRRQRL